MYENFQLGKEATTNNQTYLPEILVVISLCLSSIGEHV